MARLQQRLERHVSDDQRVERLQALVARLEAGIDGINNNPAWLKARLREVIERIVVTNGRVAEIKLR